MSKRLKWNQLWRDVENDPWRLGYRIVMRKLGSLSPTPSMDAVRMEHIVNTLFPSHPVRCLEARVERPQGVLLFTREELMNAASKLRNRKAPGPDGIPGEVLKVAAKVCPEVLLSMYNRCLEDGVFPKIWKKQRLVLIGKGKGSPNLPSAYRPLSMLDVAGKLLEKLLRPRLAEAIREAGDLSERQYGFRQGRSTIGAIKEVVSTFQLVQQRNHYSKEIVLLVTLDVKNAFNSARWIDMLEALEQHFRIPEYLLRMVKSYLMDRQLIYETADGERGREVTGGAAQGSILGPDLWNASYDGILRMQMPPEAFLVGYADDVAAIIVARNTDDAQLVLNMVMRRVSSWLQEHGLTLAAEKTELVLLTRKRIPTAINFWVGGEEIQTKPVVKYLGVHLDNKLSFWEHIRCTSEKAVKVTSALSRLMANTGGPTAGRRRLLMSVTDSILLYGCEIWADTLRKEKYRKRIASVQRRSALRVASSYRTVSEPAVQVIAGVIPIDLKAQERKFVFDSKEELGVEEATRMGTIISMQCWQARWDSESRGRWTKRLIGNIAQWMGREHGEVDYYLTQFLSGHGYFGSYLHRMGKRRSPACVFGDSAMDDVEHTFFRCRRWSEERRELVTNLLEDFEPGIVVGAMLRRHDCWNMVAQYVENILRAKKPVLDRDQLI